MIHVDGSSGASKGRTEIYLQGLDGFELKVVIKLNFKVTNNKADYEALIV